VLQTGGEAGMWNIERYQRWIAQKKDWVPPGANEALPPDPTVSQRAPMQRREVPKSPASVEEIPIEVEEVDLDALARSIENRKV
jgi:hypothetical protein